jgi:uncharacterized repeat protein (TIGR01451 family)
MRKLLAAVAIVVLGWAAAGGGAGQAAAGGPWYVSTDGDDGDSCLSAGEACATLNAAIAKADPGDTILVAGGVYTGTGAEVALVDRSLTLAGGWNPTFTTQNDYTIINGQVERRGLSVAAGVIASIDRFGVQYGQGQNIYNEGTLTVNNSSIVYAATGVISPLLWGGVTNLGVITITHSSLVGNASPGLTNLGSAALRDATFFANFGAGVNHYGSQVTVDDSLIHNNGDYGLLVQESATLIISGTTVTGHSNTGLNSSSTGLVVVNNSTLSGSSGSGIWLSAGQLQLSSSTLRGNTGMGDVVVMGGSLTTTNSIIDKCVGNLTSEGHNLMMDPLNCVFATGTGDLLGVDPGPWLGLSGEPGQWQLPPGSPAIDAGDPGGCTDHLGNLLAGDQVGRPRFGICDIGAYELQPLELAAKTVDAETVTQGGTRRYTIVLPNAGETDIAAAGMIDTLPGGLTLLPGTLQASSGSPTSDAQMIFWNGAIAAGASVTVTYEARATGWALGSALNQVRITSEGVDIRREAVVEIVPNRLYLPSVLRPDPGLYGTVTQDGLPAEGIPLDLRFFDGSNWYTVGQAVTNAAGHYHFANVTSLAAGQRYYVLFRNPSQVPGRLWLYGTRTLTQYTGGSAMALEDFDIADIALGNPANEDVVTLPYRFTWTPRPATPGDSYEFNLFDPFDNDPYAYTPPLGYVGGYTLYGLPEGFDIEEYYVWDMWLYSPAGGYGISLEARWVAFWNEGLSQSAGTGGLAGAGASAEVGPRSDMEVWGSPRPAP